MEQQKNLKIKCKTKANFQLKTKFNVHFNLFGVNKQTLEGFVIDILGLL